MISPDLDARWRGAVYALSPRNPDASRHFCSSAREFFTQLIHTHAPDDQVLAAMPFCEKTDNGRPTRRARISYILQRKGLHLDALEDFVERNVENVLRLFADLNTGTHGPAGRYSAAKLGAIKTRAEEAILFMARLLR